MGVRGYFGKENRDHSGLLDYLKDFKLYFKILGKVLGINNNMIRLQFLKECSVESGQDCTR